MPMLSEDIARDWSAVGVVNAGGAEGLAACSGTLVAPDLVLTAAHCTGAAHRMRFNLGGIGDRNLMTVPARNVVIHPEYHHTKRGPSRFAVDLALVTLADPVPADIARPLTLLDPEYAADIPGVALLGYHRMRPAGLNGRFDCPFRPGPISGQLTLDCQVISGNSGGPASIPTPDGYRVIGIAVARMKASTGNVAIVTLIDQWARAHIAAAQGHIGPRKTSLP